MEIHLDGSNQPYLEVPTDAGEFVRVTLVPKGKGGYSSETVRIQIREANGHLRAPCPEVPVDAISQFIAAVVELLRSR